MYGLVNKAVKDLVISSFGDDAWTEIAKAADVEPHFISMDTYDDAVTYRLVEEASKRLDVPAEDLLRKFGEYWITYTASEGYGPIVDMFGESLEEFLRHLGNDLHGRVAMTMPDLHPPEFATEEIGPSHFHVHYKSHRQGLSPMVLGLLEGLAARYQTKATVTHKETLSETPSHEVFEVIIH